MIDAIKKDASQYNYNRIVAVGGGTVIDICKVLVLGGEWTALDMFENKVPRYKEKTLFAVPTTCGTGTEVTNVSIASLIARNTKLGMAIPEIFPDYAIIIPDALATLPYKVFATSSIDALIHAVESYTSPKATVFTELFGEKAMELIINGYLHVKANGPDSWRDKANDFLTASTFAGISFGNAGCAAVHALAYPLGGIYHIPHGEANQLMFTAVYEAYKAKKPGGKLAKLEAYVGKLLGVPAEKAIAELDNLLEVVLHRKALREYNIPESSLAEMAASVVKNQTRLTANNYVPFTEEEYLKIYQARY